MNATACNKVLYAAELAPLMKPLQALASSARFEAVPSFQEMLDGKEGVTPYPYVKTFEEARNDPIVVLHSSGSTGKETVKLKWCQIKKLTICLFCQGLPKPITITHGSVAAHDNDHNISAPPNRKKQDTTVFTLDGENRRLYSILPFFHVSLFLKHKILEHDIDAACSSVVSSSSSVCPLTKNMVMIRLTNARSCHHE